MKQGILKQHALLPVISCGFIEMVYYIGVKVVLKTHTNLISHDRAYLSFLHLAEQDDS